MTRLQESFLRFGTHPLSLLWLLAAVGIAGGTVELLFFDRLPWEGYGAAGVIAGMTRMVARVKGIPPWPWSAPPASPPSSR